MKRCSSDARSEGQSGDSLLKKNERAWTELLYFKTFNFEPPQVIVSFRQGNVLPRRRSLERQRPSAWTGADNNGSPQIGVGSRRHGKTPWCREVVGGKGRGFTN